MDISCICISRECRGGSYSTMFLDTFLNFPANGSFQKLAQPRKAWSSVISSSPFERGSQGLRTSQIFRWNWSLNFQRRKRQRCRWDFFFIFFFGDLKGDLVRWRCRMISWKNINLIRHNNLWWTTWDSKKSWCNSFGQVFSVMFINQIPFFPSFMSHQQLLPSHQHPATRENARKSRTWDWWSWKTCLPSMVMPVGKHPAELIDGWWTKQTGYWNGIHILNEPWAILFTFIYCCWIVVERWAFIIS